jgi:hypothetical protein
MLTAGESPVWLAQQMGHSDFTMIARTYGRWITDAVPDAGGGGVVNKPRRRLTCNRMFHLFPGYSARTYRDSPARRFTRAAARGETLIASEAVTRTGAGVPEGPRPRRTLHALSLRSIRTARLPLQA